MSNTYFIRGTISVRIDRGKPTIWITPCAGFLTPDKQKAIAFPDLSNTSTSAKLIKLSDGKTFECGARGIKSYLPALLAVAPQQKPIELRLEESTPTEVKITGFVFPLP